MASAEDLAKFLEVNSTAKYQIEYGGFLSNHVSHGIIALARLGASKSRIQEFIDWYIPRLMKTETNIDGQSESTKPQQLSEEELESLRGVRKHFRKLIGHFTALFNDKYKGSTQEFVSGEFPKLANGMHVAALHPLIHLGYGIEAGSSVIIIEGMAYLHFSHMKTKPLPVQSETRDKDIIEIITELKNDSALRGKVKMYAAIPTFMPDISGSFQREVGVLTTHPWVRGHMQIVIKSLKYPEWFSYETATMADVQKLADTVLHWALTVYACAEKRNDFFLLHGVTGAWSLTKILDLITDPHQAFDCIQYFIATLLSAYIAQDCPGVDISFLENPPNATIDNLCTEVQTLTTDEHVYKLVQVCKMLSNTHDEASNQTLYKVACRASMDYKFFVQSKVEKPT